MLMHPDDSGRNFLGTAHRHEQGAERLAIALALFQRFDGRFVGPLLVVNRLLHIVINGLNPLPVGGRLIEPGQRFGNRGADFAMAHLDVRTPTEESFQFARGVAWNHQARRLRGAKWDACAPRK